MIECLVRFVVRVLVRIAFYPTWWFNRLMCGLGLWRQADWVDAHVALGSLPSRKDLERLRAEGVRGVINMCEEYGGNLRALNACGLRQLRLPTLDYHCPTEAQLEEGVEFIRAATARGEKVFVHCKAGRGRSAILVMCYLMTTRRIGAAEALALLRRVRPRLARGLDRHDAVRRLEAKCVI